MSKRVIKVELSEWGIDRAIKELEKFKRDFITACNELLKQLTGHASNAAKMSLLAYSAVYTSHLYDNIANNTHVSLEEGKRMGIVRADAVDENDHAYAAYVEFGTGIIGSGDHPQADAVGWNYDINGHGESGWWYLDPKSTTYSDEGEVASGWHWTQGEPAKPFMYNAYMEARSEAPKLVARIFARL